MRRLRFLLFISIFLTLAFPQWAMSKLQRSDLNTVFKISVTLDENIVKLQRLDKQLWEVMKRYENTPNVSKYEILILALRGFIQSLRVENELAGCNISVLDELREGWHSYVRDILKECKVYMAFFLNAFKANYAIIENTAALNLMDKTIETMEDSLELSDRLMENVVG